MDEFGVAWNATVLAVPVSALGRARHAAPTGATEPNAFSSKRPGGSCRAEANDRVRTSHSRVHRTPQFGHLSVATADTFLVHLTSFRLLPEAG